MATQNVSEEQLQSQFTYIDAVARLLGDKRPKAYTHTRSAASRTRRIPSVSAACCPKWATK